MGNYIVLHNVPSGPEGRAFLRQLRKYLPPEYKIRARGNLKDRKAAAGGDPAKHKRLRDSVPCHMADRLRVYIDERVEEGIQKRAGNAWYYLPRGSYGADGWIGPFKTYDAVKLAKRLAEGTTS